ncbi:MAG: ABC transporter permease [Candidatus Helarchaeota archaeon]
MWVIQIKSLIQKELGRVKSDKRALIMLILLPLITIIIFGISSGGGPSIYYNVAIINYDGADLGMGNNSQYADTLISSFQNASFFIVVTNYTAQSPSEFNTIYEQAHSLLSQKTISVIIVIPSNFSENFEDQNTTTLECIVDGSNPETAKNLETGLMEPLSYFRLATNRFQGSVLVIPYLEYDVPIWLNQIFNYSASIIIPILILGMTMNVTALCIVTEKALPRMLLTPAGKRDIIISKLITYTLLMAIQVIVIFLVSFMFGLYCTGELISLFLAMLLIGFCGVSLGLAVSAISQTEYQANQLYIFLFIAIVMFSGVFAPMPEDPIMYGIVNAFPLAHATPLITDITLRGLGMDAFHSLSLLAICMVSLAIAFIAYRAKKVEI